MADEVLTLSPQTDKQDITSGSKVEIPNPVTMSHAEQDTDNHDSPPILGWGKGRLTVAVDNQANKAMTVSIYGTHSPTAVVSDAGTFLIGTFAVPLADKNFETCNDPFPFYIVRMSHDSAPTDGVAKTNTMYANLSAF